MTQKEKEQNRSRAKKWYWDHREESLARTRKWLTEHKDYSSKYQKKKYLKNKDGIREKRLKTQFGISLEDYKSMLDKQYGRCAICGLDIVPIGGYLCVDHNHSTGKVRGLLCHSCNLGLGWFKDDMARLQQAIEYLRVNEVL